jgi:hypothetical protein
MCVAIVIALIPVAIALVALSMPTA